MKKLIALATGVLALIPLCTYATQAGKAKTLGMVAGNPEHTGTLYNPAAGNFLARQKANAVFGELSYGANLEYGNVEELFELIDSLSSSITDGDDNNGGDGGDSGDNGSDLGDIIDIENPEFQRLIDEIGAEAGRLTAILALIATEGYARANLSAQFSALIKQSVDGGNISFDYIASASYGVVGVTQAIDFDPQTALQNLQTAYNLSPGDAEQTFDLTGGVLLTVDPNNGDASVQFENDSLLFTRGVRLQQFVLGYSQPMAQIAGGTLSWGVAPKFLSAGLTDIAVRIGDISDSEQLFEDIENAEYETDTGFGLNAGLFWDASNYRLGASLHDITETEFRFPDIDTGNYTNEEIIQRIQDSRTRKLDRQLKLEAGMGSGGWHLNASYDTQKAKDLLGFEYQWMSLSGGYHINSWLIPGFRLGYHQNMAGSELGYYAAGLTLFKLLNLDFSITENTVELDGDELPRGAEFSLSFNYGF